MANDGGRSLTKGERRLLVAVGLFVGIVLGVVCWWEQNNILPEIAIPTPVMPNPNAFDQLKLAVSLMNKTVAMNRPAGFHRNSTVSTHNGSTQATLDLNGLQQYLSDKDACIPTINLPFDPTPAEMQALLRVNAPGYSTLHQALQSAYLEPPVRAFDQLLPHLHEFRSLGQYCWVAGRVKSAGGDWNGAMDAYLEALHLGEMIPHGGILINMLVGVGIQAIARADAWKTVPHLSAACAHADAQRLATITAAHVSYAEILQEEKWCSEAALLTLFHKADWWDELERLGDCDSSQVTKLRALLVNKREVFANYAAFMDAQIADAKLPYMTSKTPPPIPNDPINQRICPIFTKARWKEAFSVTQNALLEVSLALQAYQLDHGHYPATLTALVPGYLNTIPDDPFALKGPLRYRLKGEQYVLYSVGPDGKDDGGVASQDGLASLKAPNNGKVARNYLLKEQSKGDIVAGVNIR